MQTVKLMTRPANCYELFKLGFTNDGVYEIYPDRNVNKHLSAYCEMGLGGWTTIINKVDRSLFFYESMNRYIAGFGNVSASTNYFIGLTNIYRMTNLEAMTVRIEMSNSEFDKYIMEYDLFVLGPQIEKFKIKLGKNTFGTIRDWFSHHNNMKFTTYDDDNDNLSGGNCAVSHKGGWWFNNCYNVCLTCETNSFGNWNMGDQNMGPNGYRHFSHMKMLIRPIIL